MKAILTLFIVTLISLNSCKSSNQKMLGPKGKFLVTSVQKDSIPEEEMSMNFDLETGRINGTAICNTYNATYVVSGEKIKFSPAASTKMMCPEGTSLEYNFFQALLKASKYSVKRGKLSLYSEDNVLMLTAKED